MFDVEPTAREYILRHGGSVIISLQLHPAFVSS